MSLDGLAYAVLDGRAAERRRRAERHAEHLQAERAAHLGIPLDEYTDERALQVLHERARTRIEANRAAARESRRYAERLAALQQDPAAF